ncbi:beta-L-arabinofuranosidase domain-containing protein [Dactylosporangium sp. CA-092794]|uniref:beta-L-arabinofuranosidase domain-containing protein n=1 Tax=Dactylosporangium sp. CA-092794 TaxID=3239929 RepID=UPI003D8F7C8D
MTDHLIVSRARASRELPPGAIRPRGWLERQLRLQAEGLTGQLEEIWPDVGPDSGWRGGPGENWERGPYYLDGLVPLAHVLDDERLRAKAEPWIEWIIASQDETGFFGPAANRDWWPRMVALKVLTTHADATGDERVEELLRRYFRFQLDELPRRPLESWGAARAADNALSVWWLHDRTGESWLLDLVELLRRQALDWETYLERDLITGPARFFSPFTHGPNVAMGLKAGAVAMLADGDPVHRDRTERGFAALDRWHGQVHGWFSGDEWLGGPAATAGIETCQVVEMMFTTEVQARVFGGGVYGDRLESLAFNLLAASCDPRMLAHQYHQQANQVQVSVARRGWTFAGDDANIFGLEPNYGCCTANLHQGWPKFVRALWLADADGALRSVAYAPAVVRTDVGGIAVSLHVETEYPFDGIVRIRVDAAEAVDLTLRLRIPEWCEDARLEVAGESQPVLAIDGYHTLDRRWSSGEVVVLRLPLRPRILHRSGQAVGVRVGPLQLTLGIPENWVAVPGAPGLGEWEVRPRRSWNYALDISRAEEWRVETPGPGAVPFDGGHPPVSVTVPAALATQWRLDGAEAAAPPPSPVFDLGAAGHARLVPYGSARIRVTEFPKAGLDLGDA